MIPLFFFAMNEWEFTSAVATWMSSAIQANSRGLPFSEARCEQTAPRSQKRRDLTLIDADGQPVVTGEVKMPYQPEGNSPYRANVVKDARRKAKRAGVKYFFTWNVNRCVLWPTDAPAKAWEDREYRSWDVADVHNENQLNLPVFQERIKRWVPIFLRDVGDILRGDVVIGTQAPDVRFIDGLEAALEQPILLTTDALSQQWKKASPRSQLQKWMTEEQGWVLHDSGDMSGVMEDLNRAAQFANYSLVNKLVFHESLLRRYGSELEPITIPGHVSSAEQLRTHLESFFEKARKVTGDYETVFGDDHQDIGNRIPFYADPAVAFWRMLIEQVHDFDFSKLDYEVIGSIFERLISPEERHKYGQYYTRAEVVDLINSFCIRTGRERVMDPACGGGTFLVRAYTRKRELNPQGSHSDRLRELYGTDISHFATHLTTINLATRDLIEDENYPQIARSDFFDINPSQVLLSLPGRMRAGGLGRGQEREVVVPPLDAVVGNPPYVRQEGIPKSPKTRNGPKPGTKEYYKHVAEQRTNIRLSGRSDLHVYFWLHAADFLHHGGWLGLLTSSQWLDVDYGFRLQDYILRNFEVHAIFESLDEPWFVGARVATCATLLRRQRDESARMNHRVRFVQLRRPIAEVLGHDGTAAGAVEAADRFRDLVCHAKEDVTTPEYRLRIVRQGDLWNDGVRLGNVLGKSQTEPAKDPSRQAGDYYGGKWGMHLRAPDLWAQLIAKHGDRFAPLGDFADVRFGVKSGKDSFFFPIDASEEVLRQYPNTDDFEAEFGVSRRQVESGKVKIVKCGEGRSELRPLEAELLEPEVHSLMGISRFEVTKEDCDHQIFLAGMKRGKLPRFAKAYVDWAELQKWHEEPTCASRQTKEREWYDLTPSPRADIILPKIQQYRLLSFLNPKQLYQASALLGLYEVSSQDAECIAGLLNSTIVILSVLLHSRGLGNEANIQLDVYLAQMMLVPDPRKATATDRSRVANAFEKMKGRKALAFLSERRMRRLKYEQQGRADELVNLPDETELDQPDRWALDDAVLRMIGVKDKAERERIRDALYMHLRQHFEWVRVKEEKAIANKKRAKKKGPKAPTTIAAEIIEQVEKEHPHLVKTWTMHFIHGEPLFDTYDVPTEGEVELLDDLIHQNAVRFRKGKRTLGLVETGSGEQAKLLAALAGAGVRGLVRVPHDPTRAAALHKRFRDWLEERERTLNRLIEERTGDEELQERVYGVVAQRLALV